MREILFRGKRIDNGEWVEGFYYCIKDTHFIHVIDGVMSIGIFKVDPSTIGQYTGLTDKNGKKIFEGDLLSYDCGDGDTEPREVMFLNGRWICQWYHSGTIDEVPYQTIKMANVIGNIHGNPELLKGEKE